MNLPVVEHAAEVAANERSEPAELIAWSVKRFAHQQMVITTSFGMEGCALIDMYAQTGQPLTVVYLDTMFFFPETYGLRDQMIARYPHLKFVNCGTTLTPEQQQVLYGPELWNRDPDQCCKLRKTLPMRQALAGADVWVTGIGRSQAKTRSNIRVLDWDWKHMVLKFCPLAYWDRKKVWDHIQKHDVPYNELHERGYPSIGCTHCTQPVEGSSIGEYTRAGRWSGTTKTECGLHGDGI